jgi:hypothetical protein
MKILVVDDEEIIVESLVDLIRSYGQTEVEGVLSGPDASSGEDTPNSKSSSSLATTLPIMPPTSAAPSFYPNRSNRPLFYKKSIASGSKSRAWAQVPCKPPRNRPSSPGRPPLRNSSPSLPSPNRNPPPRPTSATWCKNRALPGSSTNFSSLTSSKCAA